MVALQPERTVKLALMKRLLTLLAILALSSAAIALPKKSMREPFGLRLGMDEEVVHELLKRVAKQEKEQREEEEGGEQEVWILKRDARINYLLTRFTREHQLHYITVTAHPRKLRYRDIGSLKEAEMATDGINYSYKWRMPARESGGRPILLIARGSSRDYVTSYSIYFTR